MNNVSDERVWHKVGREDLLQRAQGPVGQGRLAQTGHLGEPVRAPGQVGGQGPGQQGGRVRGVIAQAGDETLHTRHVGRGAPDTVV